MLAHRSSARYRPSSASSSFLAHMHSPQSWKVASMDFGKRYSFAYTRLVQRLFPP
ncbi:hypothetical protein NFJ02_05g124200 [Pycnococcus provasolii]